LAHRRRLSRSLALGLAALGFLGGSAGNATTGSVPIDPALKSFVTVK
jgi:hypothetical protein